MTPKRAPPPKSAAFRSRTLRAFVVICCMAAILGGCAVLSVPNRAYRDHDPRPHKTPQKDFVQGPQLDQYEPFSSADQNHRFDLSYIEFDEKGDYWDRRQLGWTVQEINEAAGKNNLVLVVYVHGWQNDASNLRGHDVGKFHCLLKHFSDADGGENRYFGIYIAWRGKSVPGGDGWFRDRSLADLISKAIFFVPHELSIYGRKNAATRVAGIPVTEAVFQSVASVRNRTRESGHKSRTILIGHSLGALVLEKALAQALIAKVISEDPTAGGKFTTPADFVVLLNSAAESIYAKEMVDMFRRRKPASLAGPDAISSKHPLIVSITSEADWATGYLFPVGMHLSSMTGLFRKYEWDNKYGEDSEGVPQKEYFTRTPGHNDRLINYEAVPIKGPRKLPTYEDSEVCNDEMLDAFQRNMREDLTGPNGEIRFSTLAHPGSETEWELKPKILDKWQTPYWIIKVPKEIIRNHSDIFNENALALMARLIRLSNPNQETSVVTTSNPRTINLADPGGTQPSPSPAATPTPPN
jgi:hypothetical protein